MPPTKSRTATSSHGVDFVDKDNTGGFIFTLLKQIADPRSANPHNHLNKIRTADGKKWNPGFARHGFSQIRFARSGGAHQEYALGDSATQSAEFTRVFQKLYHFTKFCFGLFYACDIGKGYPSVLPGNFMAGFAKRGEDPHTLPFSL